jgi:hypothetical protein
MTDNPDYLHLTQFNKAKAPTVNVGAAMKRMEKIAFGQ